MFILKNAYIQVFLIQENTLWLIYEQAHTSRYTINDVLPEVITESYIYAFLSLHDPNAQFYPEKESLFLMLSTLNAL